MCAIFLFQYSQRLPDKYRTHALFGSGKDWPENSWKALGRQLIMEGFLKEVSGQSKFSMMCTLTKKVSLQAKMLYLSDDDFGNVLLSNVCYISQGKDWFDKARKESDRRLLLHSEELCVRKSSVR